jgi:hypothetical protein
MRRSVLWCAAAAVVTISSHASALVYNFEIILDGLQETPPVATPATGYGTATLDDQTLQFTMNGTFQDLIGASNNAHVHGPAAIGAGPAGVLFGITWDNGVTSGNFSFNGVITAGQAQTIIDELAYVNIHSAFRPGGEIRGQILPVPEPTTAALLTTGAAVLLRRRRGT